MSASSAIIKDNIVNLTTWRVVCHISGSVSCAAVHFVGQCKLIMIFIQNAPTSSAVVSFFFLT